MPTTSDHADTHHHRHHLGAAFGHPRGIGGALAAIAMAVENRGPNRAVVERLGLGPTDTVLEIGCGPGIAARQAARAVGRAQAVVAVDSAPVMIRVARLLAHLDRSPAVDWRPGSAEAIPLEDHAVTVAFAVNSWHHWQDRVAAVAELGRVVRPGGRIAIAERTEASRHRFAHGLDPAGVAAVVDGLGVSFERAVVDEVRVGREVLAVVTASAPDPSIIPLDDEG